MQRRMVLTVLGADRRGLVRDLAAAVAAQGGSWIESRLVRLGGQFAGVVRVAVDAARWEPLSEALAGFEGSGLRVWIGDGDDRMDSVDEPWRQVRLVLMGADAPGIVRDVTDVLVAAGANIEELASGVQAAPMSGEPLFRAEIRLRMPASLSAPALRGRLEAIASDLMADLFLTEEV